MFIHIYSLRRIQIAQMSWMVGCYFFTNCKKGFGECGLLTTLELFVKFHTIKARLHEAFAFAMMPAWSLSINVLSFFKVFLGGHTCPILGSLVPLFWISGDVSSGIQSQSGRRM